MSTYRYIRRGVGGFVLNWLGGAGKWLVKSLWVVLVIFLITPFIPSLPIASWSYTQTFWTIFYLFQIVNIGEVTVLCILQRPWERTYNEQLSYGLPWQVAKMATDAKFHHRRRLFRGSWIF
jgi:hypothetical protein